MATLLAKAESVDGGLLQEVEVSAYRSAPEMFSNDVVIHASKEDLERMQHTSLSQYISASTPVFLKETGNGMLSTIAFRGTASSHTTVNWEGIPVNSHTMGQVDFSQLPLFFFDQVSLYPGGASSVHGNGAIGGAVAVGNRLNYNQPLSISVHSSIGSYLTLFEGVSVDAGKGRVQSKTSLFYRRSDNDFKMKYKNEELVQENASFYDYGLLENLGVKISDRQQIEVKLWHTYYDRDIQPMKQNVGDSSKYESISNRSSKVVLEYRNDLPYSFEVKTGWMRDNQVYEEHKIMTDDWLTMASVQHEWKGRHGVRFQSKLGGDIHYIKPTVYAYMDDITELRGSVYALNRIRFSPQWTLYCNVRKDFVSSLKAPISPALCVNYIPVKSRGGHQLELNASASRNVHAPTLNDRYWGKIDNRDLCSEAGFNLQFNVVYSFANEKYRLMINPSCYRNDVKDWILWLPRGNIWKPVNVTRVLAKGAELVSTQDWLLQKCKLTLNASYAYNHTEIVEGFAQMAPFRGRQMPLLPEHTFSSSFSGEFKVFAFQMQGKYVGVRSTSDIFQQMDPYFILNASVDWRIPLMKEKEKKTSFLVLGARVENLLNEDYEVMPFRAMPQCNYSFFIRWQYWANERP